MHGVLSQIEAYGYPIFYFWIPMVLTKIYFLWIVLDRAKISVFESITDRKTRVSRDTQNVCAITIVGTALKLNYDILREIVRKSTFGFGFRRILKHSPTPPLEVSTRPQN